VAQEEVVVRPDHPEAEEVVEYVFLPPDKLQTFRTEALNPKDGTKEDGILRHGRQGAERWQGAEHASGGFCTGLERKGEKQDFFACPSLTVMLVPFAAAAEPTAGKGVTLANNTQRTVRERAANISTTCEDKRVLPFPTQRRTSTREEIGTPKRLSQRLQQ
jgi:hypothetical protein